MNPEQLEIHCLAEIERMKSALELIRTQKTRPGEKVRAALDALAYSCSLAAEPLKDEEATAPLIRRAEMDEHSGGAALWQS